MPIPAPSAVRVLWRETRRSDVIVIHDALYATSILALLFAKVSKRPVILVQHIAGIPFASPILRAVMRLANRMLTRPMLQAADELVFISETVREELARDQERRPGHLLFNGVDKRIFHPGEPHLPDVLRGRDFSNRKRRLLFVGRYVEKKGIGILLALAKLRPDLTFVLVGSGPDAPDGWNLPNVHDLGRQSQQTLADLYRWADLLLLPSVGEGFPLVIQEAMACGLPVICGQPTERADPAAGRWLRGVDIDLSDSHSSAQRCSEAVDNFDLSSMQRAEMVEHALEHYDWTKMAERMLAFAQDIHARG